MKRATTSSLLIAAIIFFVASTPARAQHEGAEVVEEGNGPRLPMPWGLGLTAYGQRQPYDIVELRVPLAGLDIGAAEDLDIENNTESFHLKFDYWALPFLNLFVLGGHIDGTTNVCLLYTSPSPRDHG